MNVLRESRQPWSVITCSGHSVGARLRYAGRFEGRPYSFEGCLAFNPKLLKGSTTLGWFHVLGHYGTAGIGGSATFVIPAKGKTPAFPFSGHLGSQHLSGTAFVRFESGVGGTITAHLTVS